jgi:hypothetical protein
MGALFHKQGVPIGYVAVMLALVASIGGFIFGFDTGQISDILIMVSPFSTLQHCLPTPQPCFPRPYPYHLPPHR